MTKSNMLGRSGLADAGLASQINIEQVKGIGLPLATLILSAVLSAVAFGLQMVQHSFEMRQANVENGFRFYAERRTQLKLHSDVDEETSLLKLIGNAFPNVYCDVRQDVYERATATDVIGTTAPGSAPPFSEADRKNLVTFLFDNDRPKSPQFATGLFPVIFAAFSAHNSNGGPMPCDPLTQKALPPPAPVQTAVVQDKEIAAPSSGATSQAQTEANAPVERGVYRVFFHIGTSGTRNTDIADRFRDELANGHFRVMRGVVRVPNIPDRAEVRYFGPEEKTAAEYLASYLTEKFKSEKLVFTAKSIGEEFPYMSPDNIEVWIPDPKAAQKKAPAKAAPSAAG